MMLNVITPNITPQKFTLEDAELVQDKIEGKIEFMDGLIIPKEGKNPIPPEVILYILSEQFNLDSFQNQFDMPKSSYNHKEILRQLNFLLSQQINHSTYGYYVNDIEISRKYMGYFYVPDLAITLQDSRIYDDNGHLTNPKSIIEILSPSTQKKDRTEKKAYYQSLESLEEYLLISQDTYKIEQFLRKGKTDWIVKVYDSVEQTCIMTVGVKLKLSDVYQNTNWFTE